MECVGCVCECVESKCGECVNVWRVNVWSVWDACVNVWVGRHDALPSLFLRLEDWETWDLEKGHAQ